MSVPDKKSVITSVAAVEEVTRSAVGAVNTNVSIPAPPVKLSLPTPPLIWSLPSPPTMVSAAAPPVRLSLPAPPVMAIPTSVVPDVNTALPATPDKFMLFSAEVPVVPETAVI